MTLPSKTLGTDLPTAQWPEGSGRRGGGVMAFWFNVAAVIAGLGSAGLWFWAAFGPGVTFDSRRFGAFGGLPLEDAAKLQAQIRLNGFAAAAAGVSALLQAIALYLSARS